MRLRHYNRFCSSGTITATQGAAYYPFGLAIDTFSYSLPTDVNTTPNPYLYNGKELQTQLGHLWLDYGARMYDSQVGRWWSVDPMAETNRRWSPYRYVYDNPLRFIDPDGMLEDWFVTKENEYVYISGATKSDLGGTLKGSGLTWVSDAPAEASLIRDGSVSGEPHFAYTWGADHISNNDFGTSDYNPVAAATHDAINKNATKIAAIAVGFPLATFALAESGIAIGWSSLASGGADFGAQMTFNSGNLQDWNISSSVGSAIFKNPFMQAGFGSALHIRPIDIAENVYTRKSIFGEKQLPTLLIETSIGGVFNYTGGETIYNLGIKNIPGRIGAESSLLYFNYLHSNNTVNLINYQTTK